MPSIRLHEASALRSLSPKQQSLSPPLLQVTQPTITMPGNKRKRQHEGDMGGSPAITLNNAEKAARLAKDINNQVMWAFIYEASPSSSLKGPQGPKPWSLCSLQCHRWGSSAAAWPGPDAFMLKLRYLHCSSCCSRPSAGGPTDGSAWPDSRLQLGCIHELDPWEKQSSCLASSPSFVAEATQSVRPQKQYYSLH